MFVYLQYVALNIGLLTIENKHQSILSVIHEYIHMLIGHYGTDILYR